MNYACMLCFSCCARLLSPVSCYMRNVIAGTFPTDFKKTVLKENTSGGKIPYHFIKDCLRGFTTKVQMFKVHACSYSIPTSNHCSVIEWTEGRTARGVMIDDGGIQPRREKSMSLQQGRSPPTAGRKEDGREMERRSFVPQRPFPPCPSLTFFSTTGCLS